MIGGATSIFCTGLPFPTATLMAYGPEISWRMIQMRSWTALMLKSRLPFTDDDNQIECALAQKVSIAL